MEPHQKMHHIFHNLLRKMFQAIGHDIYRGEFKPYTLTFIMYGLFSAFIIGAIYTLTQYDMTTALNVVGFIGLAFEVFFGKIALNSNLNCNIANVRQILLFFSLQLSSKMYSVRYGFEAVEIMDKIIEIYLENSKTNSRKRLLLIQRFSFITEVVFKGGCIIYYLAGLFYFIDPLYTYITRHELKPMFPIYFPFIDESTNVGFAILCGIHLFFVVIATTATICSDFLFVTIIFNVPVLSTILIDNIVELSDMLNEPEVNEPLARARFKNILLMHREIYE